MSDRSEEVERGRKVHNTKRQRIREK